MPRHDQPKSAYQSDDREVLVGVYKWLFWRWMIPLIPRWITPNAITITGSIVNALAVVTAILAVNLGQPWLFMVSGILLVIYLTCDNVDGPHARRTGRASPVGELLDHGLDGIASGALLLCGGIVLRLDAVPLTVLVGIGSVAFALTMWEQYRTNLLVIPAVSGTEGVTLVLALDIVVFALGDPAWLHYDGSELISASNGVLAFAFTMYLVAMVPPVVRTMKFGANPMELLPVVLLVAVLALYSVAGAHPLYAALAMAFVGSDVAARLIHLRREEREATPLPWSRWIIALPVIPALALDDPELADIFAIAAIVTIFGFYLTTMITAAKAIGAAPDR